MRAASEGGGGGGPQFLAAAGCRYLAPRLAAALVIALAAAALVIALAAAAAVASPVFWGGDAPTLGSWHHDAAAPSQWAHPPQHGLLPAAHADPHFGPCIANVGDPPHQHSAEPAFVSPDDVYGIGDEIIINIYKAGASISNPGVFTHTRLALETGDVDRFAVHVQGTGGHNTRYNYTVQPGDYSDDLDYKAPNSLHWTGVLESSTRAVNCWLSTPGTSNYKHNSLSVGRTVVVDGIIPRVVDVTMPGGAYGAGSQLNVTVNFDEPVRALGEPPTLKLALDGANATAAFLDGNGTESLVFNYTVVRGDIADDLDYAGRMALAAGGSLTDLAGNNASLVLPEPGSPGSLGATSDVRITAADGAVAGVWSPLPDGTYPAGYRIDVLVNFSEPVVYGDQPPSLVLALDADTNRTAAYASGNNTRSLAFSYTVRQGDASAGLDYAGGGALEGGGLEDRAGDAVDASLPWEEGTGGHLGSSQSIAIDASIEAHAAGADSPGGDAAYVRGDTVRIAVDFSVPVAVTGSPALLLATEPPRSASYAGGSGTRTLEFDYTVRQGDMAADLDYAGPDALSLGGGDSGAAISTAGGGEILLLLPARGNPGSLGHARDILVDAEAPSAVGIASPSANGTYSTGHAVNITVSFDEAVVVAGAPALALATEPPRSASYAGGSGTDELAFLYVVQPGDEAADLDYAGPDALSLGNGAAIGDAAGNAANLTLPAAGPGGPLAGRSDIEILGEPQPALRLADRLVDGGSWRLSSAHGVAVFGMGGATYAVVASAAENGVQLIRVRDGGTLEPVSTLGDNASLNLAAPVDIDVFNMGNRTYAITAGWNEGVQLIRVHDDGNLTATPGGRADPSGPLGVDAFNLGNRTYAVATSNTWSGGAHLIRVLENGTLVDAYSILDNSTLLLRSARGVDVFTMRGEDGDRTYAMVASQTENGVQLLRVGGDGNGTLAPVGWIGTANNSALALDNARGMDVFETAGGRTYAAVASYDSSGVQLIRVHYNGTLEAAGSLLDDSDVPSGSVVPDSPAAARLGGANNVDSFAMGGRTYVAVASHAGDAVQLARVHENGTLEAAGSFFDDVSVAARDNTGSADGGTVELDGAYDVDAFTIGRATFAIVSPQYDGGIQLLRLSPPLVTGVSTPAQNGTYAEGGRINFTVGFDVPVSVSGPVPSILLALDGAERAATYVSGRGTNLTFAYEVRPGDNAGRLDNAGAASLITHGAVSGLQGAEYTFRQSKQHTCKYIGGFVTPVECMPDAPREDMLWNDPVDADLELPAQGSPGSLGRLRNIQIDTAPLVTRAGSPDEPGLYGAGSVVNITVAFSEAVDVTGMPALPLSTNPPRSAVYVAGTDGDAEIAFRYVVDDDDASDMLGYADGAALSLPGSATIVDSSGNGADLALPSLGGRGLLGAYAGILRIDGVAPGAVAVTDAMPKGAPYREGETVRISVDFGERLAISARDLPPSLRLVLDDGATATAVYERQAGGQTMLVFNYTVLADDSAGTLGADDLSFGDWDVADAAGNGAGLDLPGPGDPGSLASAGIQIDTKRPGVVSVSSPNEDGAHGAGSTVDIAVSFGEAVSVVGAPMLALATDPPRSAVYVAGSDGDAELAFRYSVQANDTAGRLDYANRSALSLDGGTIKDAAGNDADLLLPPTGSPTSLHASNITIGSGSGPGSGGSGSGGSGSGGSGSGGSGSGPGSGGSGSGPGGGPDGGSGPGGGPDGGSGPGGGPDGGSGPGGGPDGGSGPGGGPDGGSGPGGGPDGGSGPGGGPDGGSGPGPDGGTANTTTVVLGPNDIVGRGNHTADGPGVRIAIDVSGLPGAGTADGTVQFPSNGAVVATSFATVSFPTGVEATSVPVGGMLALHIVDAASRSLPSNSSIQEALSYDGSGRVLPRSIVEIGGGGDGRIKFADPIRISLDGQAGGRAFYVEGGANGTIRPIDLACAADDTVRVHRQLNGMGECRIESGGDMVIYTYHLTQFGTVASERGTPPPVVYTCSIRLGMDSLAVPASPGSYSEAARQDVVNSGSQAFERVDLDATPWYIDPASDRPGPGAPRLDASLTVLGTAARGVTFAPLSAAGAALGLEGGQERALWLAINLTGHDQVNASRLVQQVTYTAECAGAPAR